MRNLEKMTLEDYLNEIDGKKCIYCGIKFTRDEAETHLKKVWDDIKTGKHDFEKNPKSIISIFDRETNEIVYFHYGCKEAKDE